MVASMAVTSSPPMLGWWLDLEYLPAIQATLFFAALAAVVLWLSMRSLTGLDGVRRWASITLRLLVLLLLVAIYAGVRWQRQHRSVELLVLRDISDSTTLFRAFPGKNLQDSIDDYLRSAAEEKRKPNPDDRIGVISFANEPRIDSMPNTTLTLDAHAIREGGAASDIASAIQMAMATFQRNAMRRILLISDGNQTAGDLQAALASAAAQHVPIDVMPLHYAVQNELLIDRLSAPSFRKEGDAFDVYVALLSTNAQPTGGILELLDNGQRVEQRRITVAGANVAPDGKVEPRKHVERVHVPALKGGGVRRFKAVFTPDVVNSGVSVAGDPGAAPVAGDTLLQNNTASAFTFVQGQGRVLYVDSSRDGAGKTLEDALRAQSINLVRMGIDQVPEDLVGLQDFDAIILNNVPRGRTVMAGSGVSEKQDAALAGYVHDFGGGLVMVGGPDSFGAGGWQGSRVEQVLPVDCDIPAQRQIPKGALVLVIHSCEMQNGNYWGEQCALKAVETLSAQDEVGVISYDWNGRANGGVGGSSWNYPLAPRGDGGAVVGAIKRMRPGDMPSFEDCLALAVNGGGSGGPCLKASNAAQKHIIIISDGDPTPPSNALMQQILAAKITISTICVYPHGGQVTPTMRDIARTTGGRYYGPIDQNPAQLPQIFIKEATVVRRTLIQEAKEPPISVSLTNSASDLVKGLPQPPPIYGMVLTQRKNNPTVEMPLVATLTGKHQDPLFAHWQAGLGKAAAFTSDAAALWDQQWISGSFAGAYGKFWSQVIRGISRPPMSRDFTITTERHGDSATVTVEATNKDAGFTDFLSIGGVMIDPEGKAHEVRLLQTGPGTYTADFNAPAEGNYILRLQYASQDKQGWLVSGLVVNQSPEMRQLQSNDQLLTEIAQKTGGRVLSPFDPAVADLFNRQNLPRGASPLPVWDLLLPLLLALLLLDVACRRIAWDMASVRALAAGVAHRIRQYTLLRPSASKPTLDALKKVRQEVAETRLKPQAPPAAPQPLPLASARFQARDTVDGDITKVVGGATSQPLPAAPKKVQPKGAPSTTGHTGSLLEAKRRAQAVIKKKEQGEE